MEKTRSVIYHVIEEITIKVNSLQPGSGQLTFNVLCTYFSDSFLHHLPLVKYSFLGFNASIDDHLKHLP